MSKKEICENNRSLIFDYTGINKEMPWQCNGQWREASYQRQIVSKVLPPGEVTFQALETCRLTSMMSTSPGRSVIHDRKIVGSVVKDGIVSLADAALVDT